MFKISCIFLFLMFSIYSTETTALSDKSISEKLVPVHYAARNFKSSHERNIVQRSRRNVDFFNDPSGQFAENIISELRTVVNESTDDINNFKNDIEEQIKYAKHKWSKELADYKKEIKGMNTILEALQTCEVGTSDVLSRCIRMHKFEEGKLLHEIEGRYNSCINEQKKNINNVIIQLDEKSTCVGRAIENLDRDAESCNEEKFPFAGITSKCSLGLLAQNKDKLTLIDDLSFEIERTSFALIKLPQQLEACIADPLAQAKLQMIKAMMNIKNCTINFVLDNF